MKPVGKPDALIGHVRFDERGWETGRRLSVSARAHPRLYLESVRIRSRAVQMQSLDRVPELQRMLSSAAELW